MAGDVKVEHFDDGVSLFVIDREAKRNAISAHTALELQQHFQEFDASSQRVAVVTGAGTASFSAGADVNDVPEFWRCTPTVGIRTEKPIISAVSGWCVGGGVVFVMMSDLVVASESARFSYPEAKLGLAQGMIAGLAARIPHKVAMEVMLLGRVLDAQRAYQVGFVNELTPEGKHLDKALEMARELAGMAPLVVKMLKRFVNDGVLPKGPSQHFGAVRNEIELIAQSEDLKEGFDAWRNKRTPRFVGR